MEERLQKILAKAGYGSRRACEKFIEAGRVTVNGKIAKLGDKADPQKDSIELSGQLIRVQEKKVYIVLYKPRGYLSAVSSPEGHRTVRDLVDHPERVYPVGRLDMDSEGLILMTNDGDLTNKLTHPRYGHEKEYKVLVARRPDDRQLKAWRNGVVLEDGYRTAPAKVFFSHAQGKGAWLKVILKEGRKRQIREMGFLTGLPVVKIIRVRMGPIHIGKLKPKQWRELTQSELDLLKKGQEPKPRGKSRKRK